MQPVHDSEFESFQYLRHHMSRRDEIDVMASSALERQHHPGKLPATHLATLTVLAYAVVLAVDTVEIAVGEEDRSRAARTDQGCLLTEVRSMAGDDGLLACAAFAQFTFQTVDTATPGAQFTTLEGVGGGLRPAVEFAFRSKPQIGGLP